MCDRRIGIVARDLLTEALMMLHHPDMGGTNYSKAIARIEAAQQMLALETLEIPKHIKRRF